jgi:hypothetical protein
MRAASPAIVFAIAVLIVPSALVAQQASQASPAPAAPLPARAPHVHSYRPSHGKHNPYGTGSIIVGPLGPYYATPAPLPPKLKTRQSAKHTPKPAGAPDVFDQHSASGG